MGTEGYLYEPEKIDFPNIEQDSDDCSDSSTDSEGESLSKCREGRSKMAIAKWCECGRCVKQKTDDECFCCTEHKLIVDKMDNIECICEKEGISEYIAHRPSLEMAFIDELIKKNLRGPVLE